MMIVQAKSPGDLPGGHCHFGTEIVVQPELDIVEVLVERTPVFFCASAGLARSGRTIREASAAATTFDISISSAWGELDVVRLFL